MEDLPGSVVGQSLCHTFRALSARTFELQAHDYFDGGRLVPHEDDLTRRNLTDLIRLHQRQIRSHRFVAAEEAKNGSDWEWWLHSGDFGIGLRVQAKRAGRGGAFKFDAPAGSTGRSQCDALIQTADEEGLIPVYVLYNHRNWVPLSGLGVADCDHGPGQQAHLGCTIVSARIVQARLDHGKKGYAPVRNQSVPWHRLFCEGPVDSLHGLDAAAFRFERMDREGAEAVQRADEAAAAREAAAAAQEARERAAPGIVDDRPYFRYETLPREKWVSMPSPAVAERLRGSGEAFDDGPSSVRWPFTQMVSDEFEGADAPQRYRLPDYVKDLIAGREIEQPDERISWVVAMDLGEGQDESS
ncbi:hypothetical protein HUT16_27195 [Kitasatospora sp. NA04385]|uniref:DUF6615 family protein n=1 Tax=Kitasatospora sp. NA04385 TaxID=2742135 RepID=UPI001590AC95|nr:DUF6615 family protein [Kitasatospora sp. NA04385]QKW22266.1 hypothetical protein HUT16_27195 [Kitasatospora sp. NA04385]